MSKVRIPLDVEDSLKQDFIDRLEATISYKGSKKVKLNSVLQDLMHYVIFADELELTNILNRGRMEKENHQAYLKFYENAENEGLLEGLEIKRGNPRKAEINHYLMQYAVFPDSKEEVREKLESIEKKMKSGELFKEDCERYMNRSAKVVKTYQNYMKGVTIVDSE